MTQRPRPPKHLDAQGKGMWKRLVGELPDTSPGTLLAFEQFCFAWSKWRRAIGDEALLRWARCSRQWLAELKLTPKSRSASTSTEENHNPILTLIRRAE